MLSGVLFVLNPNEEAFVAFNPITMIKHGETRVVESQEAYVRRRFAGWAEKPLPEKRPRTRTRTKHVSTTENTSPDEPGES